MTARLGRGACYAALLCCALLLAPAAAAAAEWKIEAAPSDAMDLPAATIGNEQGHRLYLWEQHEGGTYRVFAELHLGEGAAFGGAMPTYKIDDGPVVDTDEIRRKGEAEHTLTGHVGEKAAFWLIWTSADDLVRRGEPLHDWTRGEELLISYRRADGRADTARFSLAGLTPALRDAARVEVE